MEVAVVIATYNAESYLQRAIDSVLAQTYTQWSLICVDDGSTDSSLNILKENAARDARIKVISKPNGGPASARAEAYRIMDSKYVVNLDSDDELSPDFLYECVTAAEKTGASCVMPDVTYEYSDGTTSSWLDMYGWNESSRLTGEEAFRLSMRSRPPVHGWCFWKASLMKQFAIGENATYNGFNEDEYILRVLYLNSPVITFVKACYFYHHNSDSITKKFSFKHKGYVETCHRLIDLAKAYGCSKETCDLTYEYLLRTAMNLKVRARKNRSMLSADEYGWLNQMLKKSICMAMEHRDSIHYSDKAHPLVYKLCTTNWYPLTAFVCLLKS